jgi:hypothetical protein
MLFLANQVLDEIRLVQSVVVAKLISNIPDIVFMLLVRNDFSNLLGFYHS